MNGVVAYGPIRRPGGEIHEWAKLDGEWENVMRAESAKRGSDYLDQCITQRRGVNGCNRCGGDHQQVAWKRFVNPIVISDTEEFTAWATCPTTGDPIMFVVVDAGDDDSDEALASDEATATVEPEG